MVSLSDAKVLGGIGSILLVLSVIPSAGPILGIVGFILVLIAVKYISDIVADKQIFNNMLISVILGIIGLAVGAIVGFAGMFALFGGGFPFRPGIEAEEFFAPRMGAFLSNIIIMFVIIWVFMIISAIFLRRSLNAIASKLNIKMFGTAALLFLIGAIIPIIGFILIFIASILLAVAFFSIPEKPP